MKKFKYLICFVWVLLSVMSLCACSSDKTKVESGSTHIQRLNSVNDFNRFFTFDKDQTIEKTYNGRLWKCTLLVGLKSRIGAFAEYSGEVTFRIVAKSGAQKGGHDGERIKARLNGSDSVTSVTEYEGRYGDDTALLPYSGSLTGRIDDLNFRYDLKVSTVDILVTYHNEGLSGDFSKSYETINITRYNFDSYLPAKLNNSVYDVYVSFSEDRTNAVKLTADGYLPDDSPVDAKIVDAWGTIEVYPGAKEN